PAAWNMGAAGRRGRHERASEAESLAKRDRVRFLNQQRVGPAVDREAADLLAEDHAAGARRLFEDDEGQAPPRQLVGRREARDSAADDGNVNGHRGQLSPTGLAGGPRLGAGGWGLRARGWGLGAGVLPLATDGDRLT